MHLKNGPIHQRLVQAMFLYTIGVLAVIGGISYLAIHYLIEDNFRLSLESEAKQKVQKLEQTFRSIQQDVSNLSANSLVINAILDTHGNKVYIDPFIKSYRPNGDISIQLTVCDFMGHPIATNALKPVNYSRPVLLRAAIERGIAYAETSRGEDNAARILLAYPVVWSMTGKSEGLLVAEIAVDNVVNDVLPPLGARQNDSLILASNRNLLFSRDKKAKDKFYTLSTVLALDEPLRSLNLSAEIDDYRELHLWWLFAAYALGVSCLLALSFFLSKRISSALTVQLRSLSGLAREVAVSGSLDLKADMTGPDEVRVLAASFNEMIEKLSYSQRRLESRVKERTAELSQSNAALRQSNEEKERLIKELQDALANIKTLRGLLPICSSCKKIRDDQGYWNQIELYLLKHAEVDFSHGLCPECKDRYFEEYLKTRD